jgi:hypothetical protein
MSEDRASNIETIYIPLLDEGLPVMRPTQGRSLGGEMYLVLPTPQYDPEDEHWQFLPGSMVVCMRERRDGDDILVARELILKET